MRNKGKQKADHRVKGPKEKISLMGGGFANMTFKDVKRRAIALGMPFPDATDADFGKLASFVQKSINKPDTSLIDKYDDWVDAILEERGYAKDDPMRNYMLRLGYLGEENPETKERKKKVIKGLPKTKKAPREKDEQGYWKGTKKSYTFELSARGFTLERITRRVLKKFPDANPKSIKQWYRIYLRKNESHPA